MSPIGAFRHALFGHTGFAVSPESGSTGYGDGDGFGSGSGDGFGSGDGDGDGSGSGDGYGFSDGDGYSYGDGTGYGSGAGDGSGSGAGSGDGSGYGSGDGIPPPPPDGSILVQVFSPCPSGPRCRGCATCQQWWLEIHAQPVEGLAGEGEDVTRENGIYR